MPVSDVAANSPATSSWANSVADAIQEIELEIFPGTYGQLAIPWAKLTGVPATFTPTVGNVTPQTAYGSSSANGVGTAAARNDHTHGTPALPTYAAIGAYPWASLSGVPSTFTPTVGAVTSQAVYSGNANDGVATTASRSDHRHGTPALPTAAQVGAPAAYNSPATPAGGKRIYVGSSAPTGMSEGDIWIKG